MTRMEFMTKLGALLRELPDGERLEALRYYNEYFADAGDENEQQVIRELGSPEAVAKEVYGEERWEIWQKQKALKEEQEKKEEFVFQPGNYEDDFLEEENDRPKKKMGIGMKFVLLALFFPIWFPILMVVFGAVFTVVMVILSVLIAVLATGTAGIAAGVAVLVFGIVRIIAIPSVGVLMLGVGAMLLGLGILALMLMPLCWKFVCWFVRSIVKLLNKGLVRTRG